MALKRITMRKRKNLTFEQAREFVRSQCIPSVYKYWRWWDENHPKQIPRRPNRAYAKDWKGWNDFLGSSNIFPVAKLWLPMEEAMVHVHKLNVQSSANWLAYFRDHRHELPEGIPARPDLVYPTWKSWAYWLGYKPGAKIQALQQNPGVWYILQKQGMPPNVITVGTEQGGKFGVEQLAKRYNAKVLRMYQVETEHRAFFDRMVSTLTSPYYSDQDRIASNLNQLFWELDSTLLLTR